MARPPHPVHVGREMTVRERKYRYLKRRGKGRVVHVWEGTDTACRMASTGGLNLNKYVVTDRMDGLVFCTMCRVAVEKGRCRLS